MKRIPTFVFSMLVVLTCGSCLFSTAVNMSVDAPEEIFEGNKSIVFLTRLGVDTAHDQIRWYTFTPNETDFYKFTVSNPYYDNSEIDTLITIYDSYTDAVNDTHYIMSDMNEEKTLVTVQKLMNRGQMYYVQIHCDSTLPFDTPHEMTLAVEQSTDHDYNSFIKENDYAYSLAITNMRDKLSVNSGCTSYAEMPRSILKLIITVYSLLIVYNYIVN